jgi:hypothetical protein
MDPGALNKALKLGCQSNMGEGLILMGLVTLGVRGELMHSRKGTPMQQQHSLGLARVKVETGRGMSRDERGWGM